MLDSLGLDPVRSRELGLVFGQHNHGQILLENGSQFCHALHRVIHAGQRSTHPSNHSKGKDKQPHSVKQISSQSLHSALRYGVIHFADLANSQYDSRKG